MPRAGLQVRRSWCRRRRVLDRLPFPAGTGWGEMPWRAASSAAVALSREASSATFTSDAASNFRSTSSSSAPSITTERVGRPLEPVVLKTGTTSELP